ncbi:hypothetical protein ACFLWR_05560 [Chloroflexota bacterium]
MAEKDKVYKFLNPVGIQKGVDTYPLAPRIDVLDGKTIYFSICGEGETMTELEEQLRKDYPNVEWKVKKTRSPAQAEELSEEEMKTCDGLIDGIAY